MAGVEWEGQSRIKRSCKRSRMRQRGTMIGMRERERDREEKNTWGETKSAGKILRSRKLMKIGRYQLSKLEQMKCCAISSQDP